MSDREEVQRRHVAEQATAENRHVAHIVAGYYKALCEEGVPEWAAVQLASDYQRDWFTPVGRRHAEDEEV